MNTAQATQALAGLGVLVIVTVLYWILKDSATDLPPFIGNAVCRACDFKFMFCAEDGLKRGAKLRCPECERRSAEIV
jgi:hypothetical protein